MAASDGPIPVRTLAHAARLMREARQLGDYGIAVGEPTLDYVRLLARVGSVVDDVRRHSALRAQVDAAGVRVLERSGWARFAGPHAIETERGERVNAEKVIVCTGGVSRKLPIPGFELTCTHSDAWELSSVPASMLVIGGGATGVQVASVFHAFGTRVELFQAGPRILTTEDHDVSAAVAAVFRASGILVHEDFGTIERFERTPAGIRMTYAKDGKRSAAEAALVVMAVGWAADTAHLNLASADVATDARGFIRVDDYLRTSVSHVFAAGDVIGHMMLAPQALHGGFIAATNAVQGATVTVDRDQASPIGSFTDPEYAQVGLTEAAARETFETIVARVEFEAITRMIIDGRPTGFCKLIVDRATGRVLGCHVVGDRAIDIVQLAAMAMAADMKVDALARVPFAFPTYAGAFARAAASAARTWTLHVAREAPHIAG